MKKRIYLDYAAGSPKEPNPSSLYWEGQQAKEVLEKSRKEAAGILNCRMNEVYFTSGATEALNITILGIVKRNVKMLPHIITSTIEHSTILEPIKALLKAGEAEVSFVAPDKNGRIKPESIKREIKENTILVCLAHANSEIGVIQPVREIWKIIKNFRESRIKNYKLNRNSPPFLLVDASQSALYENVSIERLGADILILDGAKMGGPRCGLFVVRKGVQISPIMFGGGQESGLRPGTENVTVAKGFLLALKKANEIREREVKRLTKLRDWTIEKILKEIPGSSLNGSLENRLPNNINICFLGHDSEFLVIKLDTLGFAVSATSACQNIGGENGSYVLEAIGKKECAGSSLRITIGQETGKKDLDEFIKILKKVVL